jgi:hypothetical protein
MTVLSIATAPTAIGTAVGRTSVVTGTARATITGCAAASAWQTTLVTVASWALVGFSSESGGAVGSGWHEQDVMASSQRSMIGLRMGRIFLLMIG